MIKNIDIHLIIRKIIISTILILLVLFPSKLQKSAKNIFGSVYAHYIKYSFVPIESRFYIHSYNYMTSSDYKPYASHVGSGNHLAYPFANKIVKKYYKNNILRPVIFFNQPYSTGVTTLLDGYRVLESKIEEQEGFLIRNYNNLLNKKKKEKEINVHGFFLELIDNQANSYVKINNKKKFNITKKNIIDCNELNNKRPFLASNDEIERNNLKLIKQYKNCFYFELLNEENLNYTIKLSKTDLVDTNNISKILYFGNGLQVKSYYVLERSSKHYNYFYGEVINQ